MTIYIYIYIYIRAKHATFAMTTEFKIDIEWPV